jgi:hypothetical protein
MIEERTGGARRAHWDMVSEQQPVWGQQAGLWNAGSEEW